MRLRHILTRADSPIRDFSNHQCDCMIVAAQRDPKVDPRPTHVLAGGWRYRLDLEQLEGLPVLRMSAVHAQLGPAVRWVPATGLKELNPWTAEDSKIEGTAVEKDAKR